VVLTAFAVASTGFMHDWLAWNAARWDLGRRAVAKHHVDPTDVEGGLEWDGWYARQLRPPIMDFASRQPRKGGLILPHAPSFFPDVTGHYGLAFSVPAHAVPVAAESYSQWIPPGERPFLLVRYDERRR